MPTVVSLDDASVIDQVTDALARGEVVVVPTDTVYGLATRAETPGAGPALFAVKDRPPDVPVAVLVADGDQARALLADLPEWASSLVERHWPGPLTVVGARRSGVTLDLGEPADSIGVRCPDHDLLRAVARRVGPLATTSANLHGRPTPATAAEVVEQLGGQLPRGALVVDGGPCHGAPSTVVDVRGDGPVILRQGDVDPSDGSAAAGS